MNTVFEIGANVIVWLPFEIANVCVAGPAAAYVALPFCDAVMLHVPGVTKVSEPVPETVHTPVAFDTYDTASPDEAVAPSAGGVALRGAPDIVPKVIDWLSLPITNVCVSGVAAA